MTGPRCAFKTFRQSFYRHISRKVDRIDFAYTGRKYIIDVILSKQRRVTSQIARIFVEVFLRSKLDRINKNRNNDYVADRARFTHETQMSFVKSAHRRHKTNPAMVLAANLPRDGHHAFATVDNLHKNRSQKSEVRSQ